MTFSQAGGGGWAQWYAVEVSTGHGFDSQVWMLADAAART